MTTASAQVIKEENPELYKAISERIQDAPDPRPITAREAFKEQWTSTTAWNRLLHELQSLGVSEEDSALLAAIQSNNIGSQHNLKERLTQWRETYPMVTWTLSITDPTMRRYIAVATHEIAIITTISAKQITPELIDHIRDADTARTLRAIKAGTTRAKDTFNTLKRAVREGKIGKAWWIATQIDLDSIDRSDIALELYKVFTEQEDDESAWPILENMGSSFPTLSFLNSIYHYNRTVTPPSAHYGRLLRRLWDDYLAVKIKDNIHETNFTTIFIDALWPLSSVENNTHMYVDPDLALYMMRGLLAASTTQRVRIPLDQFDDPMYVAVWRELMPFLEDEAVHITLVDIAVIAIKAHRHGFDDIAQRYADVFIRTDNVELKTVLRSVMHMEGFEWLYELLDEEEQRVVFYGLAARKDVYGYTYLASQHTGAVLPLSYYDDIVSKEVTKEWIRYTLVPALAINLMRGSNDMPRILRIIDIIGPSNYRLALSLVAGDETVGALFLSLIPKEYVTVEFWYQNHRISLATFNALVDIVGYPSGPRIADVIKHSTEGIDILDAIPREKLVAYADNNAFKSLGDDDRLTIAKKYNIKSAGLLGDAYVTKLFTKRLLKLNLCVIKDVITLLPDTAPWNDLLMMPDVYNHTDANDIVRMLIARGADPSFNSSKILVDRFAKKAQHTRLRIATEKAQHTLLRLLATEKALEKLVPSTRSAIEKFLATTPL